jgi:thioredoxin reductase (NADPH)
MVDRDKDLHVAMTDATPSSPPQVTVAMPLTLPERIDQMFPTLTMVQIARVAAHGGKRQLQPGEIVQEVGAQVRFFVVTAGKIDIFSILGPSESLVATLQAGQFTGEVNLLSGRRGLTRIRASEAGEVIELEREGLLDLLQTDSELSDIVMRAFILRRVELIAHGVGDAVLVGSTYSPDTLRIKEFLIRNGHPHAYIDLDRDNEVQHLLDRFHVGIADIPVLICRGESVLRNPTNQQIADCLGFNEAIDQTHLRDLVVIGADSPDLPPRFTARRRGWVCWCWNRLRQADKRARVRRSRTTLVFLPEFPGRNLPVAPSRRRKSLARKS